MMIEDTARGFYERYDWFKEFFEDLAKLIHTISEQPELKEYKISGDAPPGAPNYKPQWSKIGFYRFPDPISVTYDHTMDERLPVPSLVSVLSADALKTGEFSQGRAQSLVKVLKELPPGYFPEPSLAVFVHEPLPHTCTFTKKLSSDGELFRGDLECDKKPGESRCTGDKKPPKPECEKKGTPDRLGRRFSFFLVPLDAFSDGNCKTPEELDTAIGNKIIKPLRELLIEFGKASSSLIAEQSPPAASSASALTSKRRA
jgi:hypothetical protein